MIAKVRIAPIERWCAKPNYPITNVVGAFVEIDTERMTQNISMHDDSGKYCSGRQWPVLRESANTLRALFGQPPHPSEVWLCEHMLEMD